MFRLFIFTPQTCAEASPSGRQFEVRTGVAESARGEAADAADAYADADAAADADAVWVSGVFDAVLTVGPSPHNNHPVSPPV